LNILARKAALRKVLDYCDYQMYTSVLRIFVFLFVKICPLTSIPELHSMKKHFKMDIPGP